MPRLPHRPVDHGPQRRFRQVLQVREVVLAGIAQECGDLGVVHHASQRDALACGEDQRMEPHGHHSLHPAQRPNDGAGTAGVIQKVVRNVQPLGRKTCGGGVQMLFHCCKHRDQPIGLIGVAGRRAKKGGFFLKAPPLPQSKAEIPPLGRDTGTQQNAVDLIVLRLAEGQGWVCREEDFRFCDTHGPQLLPGVRLPEGDNIHIAVEDSRR